MADSVTNPRLAAHAEYRKRLAEIAASGDVPVMDQKNDGGGQTHFVQIMKIATTSPTDIGSYTLDPKIANRGSYARR